jgi:hypothetical protein
VSIAARDIELGTLGELSPSEIQEHMQIFEEREQQLVSDSSWWQFKWHYTTRIGCP